MRVITGSARGRRLITLPGSDIVRPTSDKVKEAIFSSIQFDIDGRCILDLFAGSGQLGIEALSRGAASAVFVDKSPASISIIKQNLETTGLAEKSKVINTDYSSYLLHCNEMFDIAFLDPPYAAGILPDALNGVVNFMSNFGFVFCEHPVSITLPESVGMFRVNKIFRFGGISVTMYKGVIL